MADYTAPLSTLTVDLDAIAANWLSLKGRAGRATDCAAVVKADAYGLGAVQVAPHLYQQGCRHFFVAHATEAQEIAGPLYDGATLAKTDEAQIYLLNGPWGLPAKEMAAAGFVPVLNSLDDLRYWAEAAPGKAAILHIDTGMNRLGLSVADLEAPDLRGLLDKIDLRYVMSHLACADEAENSMNVRQRQAFLAAAARLQRPLRLSFANSGGIFLGPDYHFDLLRPGCALYGIHPQAQGANPMRPVAHLSARVVQLRDVAPGETVGYGATYQVPENSGIKRLATLSLGYADGFLRSLSGRGQVIIGGKACALVGRVSMDSVVADVTGVAVSVGDMAEILGQTQKVDDLAAQAGTIGYEILTSLGRRYARSYKGERI